MSYILDALRKSERERQITAKQSSALLSPVEIQPERNPWLLPGLLSATGITAFCLLVWWLWPQQPPHVATPLPTVITTSDAPVQHRSALPATSRPTTAQQTSAPDIATPQPALTNNPAISPASPVVAPPLLAVPVPDPSANPLANMPALNIAGYVHDAQNGNLAMINNQLVREGEEIAPGLRLVKILEDSAVFSYKGYIFNR